LFPLALVAYTAGIVLSILGTIKRSRAARTGSLVADLVAWCLHLAALATYSLRAGHLPLANLWEFLLTLAWLVAGLHLLASIRWKIHATGLILPPLAFVMTVAAMVRIPAASDAAEPMLQKVDILLFHTTLATLGMAMFFVAAAMSLLYVIQERAIKTKKKLKLLDRLPPLDRADRAGLEAMIWGFPLFTLGIVTGMALSAAEYHRVLLFQAKQVFPLIAWAIFGAVLLARLARGFRGRRAAYLTMTGFVLGLLTIVGIGG
jgi:ABC-type uncharacterized transport system permease subunit